VPGLVETPSPEAPPPTPEAPAQPTPAAGELAQYVVQSGDSLSWIAGRHGVTLQALIQANAIANPSIIHAGMVITIPAAPIVVVPPTAGPPQPTVIVGKQLVAVLSTQRVYAFENGQLVAEFIVSTGMPYTPTVQGAFAIYLKVAAQAMSAPGYFLPDVPWVSYFHLGYSFHGTYWHSNFGRPMSHGCVNMRIEDAQWVYDWATVGTPVLVLG
jgi:lipoprotein-anchoring transpeptidase ErfK/SrfK